MHSARMVIIKYRDVHLEPSISHMLIFLYTYIGMLHCDGSFWHKLALKDFIVKQGNMRVMVPVLDNVLFLSFFLSKCTCIGTKL